MYANVIKHTVFNLVSQIMAKHRLFGSNKPCQNDTPISHNSYK